MPPLSHHSMADTQGMTSFSTHTPSGPACPWHCHYHHQRQLTVLPGKMQGSLSLMLPSVKDSSSSPVLMLTGSALL